MSLVKSKEEIKLWPCSLGFMCYVLWVTAVKDGKERNEINENDQITLPKPLR